MQNQVKIGMIGAGKMATNLAMALVQKAGCNISWVWSRTNESADRLARQVSSRVLSGPAAVLPEADLIIISVPDDVTPRLASSLIPSGDIPVVHTSGSLEVDVLPAFIKQRGVLYPLQTFSLDRPVDFSKIPVFIQAEDEPLKNLLLSLAKKLSPDVTCITGEQRLYLHIAAVFACNFSNYLYSCAEQIMSNARLPFSVLYPLITETAAKAIALSPSEVQTGPAKRGDLHIIEKHLDKLKSDPDLHQIYTTLSDLIMKSRHNEEL